MTRTFKENIQCPECGHWHTVETPFERWMRNHPELDSTRAGIVRFDCDILLHRYLTPTDKKGVRDIQCVMFVEVKTFMGELTDSQQDTLSLFSQFLRNRKTNIHQKKRGKHVEEHTPYSKAYSNYLGKSVAVWAFGGHLLQLSDVDPEKSHRIKWDYKAISVDCLIQLLRFEVDPDSLRPIDWRRRYSNFKSVLLELPNLKAVR